MRHILLAFVFCAIPMGLSAQSSTDIRHKTKDLETIQKKMSEKEREQERLRKETEKLEKTVEASRSRLRDVQASVLNVRQRTGEVERSLAEVKNTYDRTGADIAETNQVLTDIARIYVLAHGVYGPAAPVPAYALEALRQTRGRLGSLQNKHLEQGEALTSMVDTQKTLRQETDRQETTLARLRSNIDTTGVMIEKTKTRQQIVDEEITQLRKSAAELASLIDLLRSRAKVEEENERRERMAKAMSGHSPIPPRSLLWPVHGDIVERFGRQQHKELGTPYISNGVVINGNLTEAVQAVADGRVLYAGNFMSYGGMVVVEHPGDWFSVYGRMGRWIVEKGQELRRGDHVGQPGPNETGTGEVYFELRFYGKPTDPVPWLAGQ